MRAAVVDAGANFAGGGLVELEELAVGFVEGLGENFGLGVVLGDAEVLEAGGEGEEFAEAVPAEEVFLGELLDVLGGGAAGAGFEEAAAFDQGDDGEHLGRGADFEDREEVGEVVAEDVAGDADGVLAFDDALEADLGRVGGGEDLEVEALGVVVLQVELNFGNELGVVGAGFIEPEDGGRAGEAGAVDGEFNPVADREVLGLAGAPDVALLDGVFEEGLTVGVDDADGAGGGRFEGLVVGAVFFGGLGHEADVGNGADGGGVERAVGFDEVDGGLVNAGVAAVGNEGEGVAGVAFGVVDFATGAEERGDGGVDDDVGGDVEVGDAFVGVDVGEGGAGGEGGLDVGLDGGFLVGGEFLDLGNEVAEAVVEINAEGGEDGGVFGEEVFEEDADGVAEEDGVGDLHHGGLEVEREENAVGFGLGDLLLVEGNEGFPADLGGVEDLAGLEGELREENLHGAVGAHELDLGGGGSGEGEGFLVGEEVVGGEGGDAGLGAGREGFVNVRVLLGVILDGLGGAAVGVAFAEDGVHGGTEDLGVTGAGVFLGVGRRGFGVVGEGKALGLKLGDGGLQLRDGGGDVGQLDDVGLGLEREGAELGEGVGGLLVGREEVGEVGEDAGGDGDVAGFHVDAGLLGVGLHDRQEAVGGERGGFVGDGVDDGWAHSK